MKPSEILLKKIKEICPVEIPDSAEIKRTYAGRVQRSYGAMSWFVYHPDLRTTVGGYDRVTDLVKCPNLIARKIYGLQDIAIECGCNTLKCKGLQK